MLSVDKKVILAGLSAGVLSLAVWLLAPTLARSTLTYAETPVIWRQWGAGPGYIIVWYMLTPAVPVVMGALVGKLVRRLLEPAEDRPSFKLTSGELFTIVTQVLFVLVPGLMSVQSYASRDAEQERRESKPTAREDAENEAARRALLDELHRSEPDRSEPAPSEPK